MIRYLAPVALIALFVTPALAQQDFAPPSDDRPPFVRALSNRAIPIGTPVHVSS